MLEAYAKHAATPLRALFSIIYLIDFLFAPERTQMLSATW